MICKTELARGDLCNMEHNLSQYLKQIRSERNLSLRDLEHLTGVSYSYLSVIERGHDARSKKTLSPTLEVIIKIAKGLNIPLGQFLINSGFADNDYINHGQPSALKTKDDLLDVLINYLSVEHLEKFNEDEINSLKSFVSRWWEKHKPSIPDTIVPTKQIPILGTIRAGEPMFADQNILGYMPTPVDCNEDECFYLQVKGDSMEPTLADGSLVLIKANSCFNNSDICAVMIDEEATLKRVYKYNDKIDLVPDNPKYPRMVYTNGNIRVVGPMLHEIRYYNKKA
jgi:repressor LexA